MGKITFANNVYNSYLVSCLIEVKAYLESRQIFKFDDFPRKKDK
jgi:hypothetical protein